MCESEPVGSKVGEMFEAARTGCPKLQVFRAGGIGIPANADSGALPAVVAFAKAQTSLTLLDLRGNKYPMKPETKEALEGCKRDGLELLLAGIDKGEGDALDSRAFYSGLYVTKAFVKGENEGAAANQKPFDPNKPFS